MLIVARRLLSQYDRRCTIRRLAVRRFKIPNRTCITFLTDLGTADTSIGQLKGVARGVNHNLDLVDLTHQVPLGQVGIAAFLWNESIWSFPSSTIHVGLVGLDPIQPGRLIAAEIGDYRFVCPDNGILSYILDGAAAIRAVALDETTWSPRQTSPPNHLATMAAAWSLGGKLAEFGSVITDPLMTLPGTEIIRRRTSVSGIVARIDRRGNLVTNIDVADIPDDQSDVQIEIGSLKVTGIADPWTTRTVASSLPENSESAQAVADGDPVAWIEAKRLIIGIRNGHAGDEFQVEVGRKVLVRWSANEEKG